MLGMLSLAVVRCTFDPSKQDCSASLNSFFAILCEGQTLTGELKHPGPIRTQLLEICAFCACLLRMNMTGDGLGGLLLLELSAGEGRQLFCKKLAWLAVETRSNFQIQPRYFVSDVAEANELRMPMRFAVRLLDWMRAEQGMSCDQHSCCARSDSDGCVWMPGFRS